MSHVFNVNAPKKKTSLSINSDLLRQAETYGINLSTTLEKSLEMHIRQEKERRWLEENKEAIGAYNDRIDKYGTLGQRLRGIGGSV